MLSNDSKGSVVFKRVHKFSSRNDSVIPFCVFAWVHGKLFYLPWIVDIFINEISTQMKGRGSSEIQCMVKHSPAQISQWGKLLFWHGYLLSVFFPVLNNFCEDAMPSLEIDLSVFVCILLYITWYVFFLVYNLNQVLIFQQIQNESQTLHTGMPMKRHCQS